LLARTGRHAGDHFALRPNRYRIRIPKIIEVGIPHRNADSTAWGSPNVVSVPIQQLMEFSEAQ
jgi:hypothetical protein